MVARRLPGQRLDLLCPRLSGSQRRDGVVSLAGALKALHGWTPPSVIRVALRPTALVPVVVPDDIVGAGIMPLPVPRVFSLLDWLEEQPGMGRLFGGLVRIRIGEVGPPVSEREFEC